MSDVVHVVPEIDISIDGRAGSTQTIPLRTRIPTSEWKSGVLQVLLHAKNTWSTTATASILVQNAVYTPDDPSTAFSGSTIARVDLTNNSAASTAYTEALDDAPIGMMVNVILSWEQGATATAAQTASVSVTLVGRMY